MDCASLLPLIFAPVRLMHADEDRRLPEVHFDVPTLIDAATGLRKPSDLRTVSSWGGHWSVQQVVYVVKLSAVKGKETHYVLPCDHITFRDSSIPRGSSRCRARLTQCIE